VIDSERFVTERRDAWRALESLLDRGLEHASDVTELSARYRAVCADLSRARGASLPDEVVLRLDALSARAHDALYGARDLRTAGLGRFLVGEVPRQIRASWRWVALSSALFFGPLVFGLVLGGSSRELAARVVDEAQLARLVEMYAVPPDDRSAGDAARMAGFYVLNNVGIALRCFATGVLGGLGSVFFLVVNGATIGVAFGHLGREGFGLNLVSFTAGHATWELLAIVLAGAAGLRLGWSLVATEGRTRFGSAQAAAPELLRLVGGASFMLLVAAAIEGFWSASPVPLPVKLGFGFAQLVVVAAWWTLGGRR
jgi:uncharacterized membrane protein SpoIIM required for sporulation